MSGGPGRAGKQVGEAAGATPMLPASPAPSSCLMTEWGEWDECSATCGMGMKKRHRMIKMSPADGSMCKAETSQAEKCMMPECREWERGWAWRRPPGTGVEGHSIHYYHHEGRRLSRRKAWPTVLAGHCWEPDESHRCVDINQNQRE